MNQQANTPWTRSGRNEELPKLLTKKILVIDGAMGTMIQQENLSELDYRGANNQDENRFQNWETDLTGANDLLSLTRPDIIGNIHRAYLAAGCDILETNTFNSTTVALADYSLESFAQELNCAGARLARSAADEFEASDGRPRYVAGVLGPTNRTASISPDVENASLRNITFRELEDAYLDAAIGLIDGGSDLILIETVFDTLNAKAAIVATERAFESMGTSLPIMISGTITDLSGRTLSGQTAEAFWYSVRHARPISIGFNCALGATDMRQHVQAVANIADCAVSAHPNAGLPNEFGEYDETPEIMAAQLREFAESGLLNMVGGCCGTTPHHIAAIAAAVEGVTPRKAPSRNGQLSLAGLEPLVISDTTNFVNIGERTNVTGSRKFARLIESGEYEEAVEVARQQIEGGAQIIDINMDEGMIDSVDAMVTFLNLLSGEPDIARVPFMIDSSRFEVIEAGLECVQGKAIANSISLKDGEEEFLRRARRLKQFGAAMVVMAFDEVGQADTLERRIEISERAWRLLVDKAGVAEEDIIFDPNVFAVGTGLDEHLTCATDFIEATRHLKEVAPRCHVSGGISNVSFSFRGNDFVREAIHAVFLYHAIAAGLDMGIVNAGALAIYDEVPRELRDSVENVVLNRKPDATEHLLEMAQKYQGDSSSTKTTSGASDQDDWLQLTPEERIVQAIVKGIDSNIVDDVDEVRTKYERPIAVIEGPLMDGMNIVGERFGDGRMFLPQVVKSARVMKKAVAHLVQFMEAPDEDDAAAENTIVMATVKGDVHDIGKNIVSVVLECNGFRVIDLGVMVPSDRIINEAINNKARAIGLSGLITPSLDEMRLVAAELSRQNLDLPLLIGGATTSRIHTAVKIEPEYPGKVVHVSDASRAANVVSTLFSDGETTAGEFLKETSHEYARMREERGEKNSKRPLCSLETARQNKVVIDWSDHNPVIPNQIGVNTIDDYPLADLVDRIDWSPFFSTWDLRGRYPAILDYPKTGPAAIALFDDAQKLLNRIVKENLLEARAVYGIFPAVSSGDDVELLMDDPVTIHFLRQQATKKNGRPNYCLSDFIAPAESGVVDYLGMFVVTTGIGLDNLVAEFENDSDDYNAIMAKALADRLAEAFAERLHELARTTFWGYAADENLTNQDLIDENYTGIRPAPGYPACPEHSEKETIFRLLNAEDEISVSLTESWAMLPGASVSGYWFAHPQARYFGVGKIGEDQVEDYARRKSSNLDSIRRVLAPVLR